MTILDFVYICIGRSAMIVRENHIALAFSRKAWELWHVPEFPFWYLEAILGHVYVPFQKKIAVFYIHMVVEISDVEIAHLGHI